MPHSARTSIYEWTVAVSWANVGRSIGLSQFWILGQINRPGFITSEWPRRGTPASDHRRRPACYALRRQPPTAFLAHAFFHYLRLSNFLPHGDRPSSPFEMCGASLPNLSRLRTFGCRVYMRPTAPRSGQVIPNARTGLFLGYSRTLKVMYYSDLESSIIKTATHARFDEGMNMRLGGAAPKRAPAAVPGRRRCHQSRNSRHPPTRSRWRFPTTPSSDSTHIHHSPLLATIPLLVLKSQSVTFAHIPVAERRPELPLHLSVDQLRAIHDIQYGLLIPASIVDDSKSLAVFSLTTTTHGTPTEEQRLGSFTRRKLRRLSIGPIDKLPSSNSWIPWPNRTCMARPFSPARRHHPVATLDLCHQK